MARIAGINIPSHQHTDVGLTAIYGIGRPRAREICNAVGVPFTKKVKDLTDDELEKLRTEVGKLTCARRLASSPQKVICAEKSQCRSSV